MDTRNPADWIRSNIRQLHGNVEFNDHQLRAIATLTSYSSVYNMHTVGSFESAFAFTDKGVSLIVGNSFATFDSDELTELVIAAHKNCVRVEIGSWAWHNDTERATRVSRDLAEEYEIEYFDLDDLSGIRLLCTARDREATDRYDSHPDLDVLIALVEAAKN